GMDIRGRRYDRLPCPLRGLAADWLPRPNLTRAAHQRECGNDTPLQRSMRAAMGSRRFAMKITRREVVSLVAAAGTGALEQSAEGQQTASLNGPVSIDWLGGSPPPLETGVSWGVPWPRGAVRKDQTFSLTVNNGRSLPLQSWTLAYWPDDSVKWTGFATVA